MIYINIVERIRSKIVFQLQSRIINTLFNHSIGGYWRKGERIRVEKADRKLCGCASLDRPWPPGSYSCQGLNRRLTAHFPAIFRFVTQVESLNRDRRNVHLKYRPNTSRTVIDWPFFPKYPVATKNRRYEWTEIKVNLALHFYDPIFLPTFVLLCLSARQSRSDETIKETKFIY